MNIRGRFVTLRAIERGDLPLLQTWSNDPEIQYLLGGWHFPSSALMMEKWLERLQTDHLNQRFAVEINTHGLIGMTNLININWKDRNAFTGIMLGPEDMRHRGYGTDAVTAVMHYAFQELGLERLDTTIIEYNDPSYRMYIKHCGWREEGRKRNFYWRKNRYWDQIIIGIDRSDYLTWSAGQIQIGSP